MPLYEYECASCRNRFEVRQRMVDDPIKVCPSCGGVTKRVLHAAGIIFKGSGWYITDSRKSETASTPGEKPNTESKTENAKTESKSDTSTKDTSAKDSSTSKASSDSTSKPAASTKS